MSPAAWPQPCSSTGRHSRPPNSLPSPLPYPARSPKRRLTTLSPSLFSPPAFRRGVGRAPATKRLVAGLAKSWRTACIPFLPLFRAFLWPRLASSRPHFSSALPPYFRDAGLFTCWRSRLFLSFSIHLSVSIFLILEMESSPPARTGLSQYHAHPAPPRRHQASVV